MANPEIPEEIVLDIMKRLPVKSLMRFQCVSPAWRVLIKSPFFRNLHFKHQKLVKNDGSSRRSKEDEEEYIMVLSSPRTEYGNAEFSFYTRGNAGELLPMKPPADFPVFPHRKMELCAPCNGIFCVVTKIDDNEFYLCNPATRECHWLPERPFGCQLDKFPRSGVSYVMRTAWGFGVDPRTDECKVVSVMYYGTNGERYYFDRTYDLYDSMVRSLPFVMNHGIIQFEIYDVSSDSWREVDVELPDAIGLVKRKENESYVYTMDHWRGCGLFLKGCLHWLYNAGFEEVILSFDINTETMQAFKVPLPGMQSLPLSTGRSDALIVFGDSLALVVQAEGGGQSIWVMEEYGVEKSWVKRYSFAPYSVPLHILHSWKDDGGDLLLFQAANRAMPVETLVSCNASGDRYHTYPLRAVAKYLILRAIVVSDQTLVSVRPATSDQTLDPDESVMMQADVGGCRSLVSLSGYWGIALVILLNLYAYAR